MENNYSGFWRRVGASIIDSIIMAAIFIAAVLVLSGDKLGTFSLSTNVLGIAFGWLYFALQESSSLQATIGKRALGIKVTGLDGERISFGRATGRHFGKYLSQLILFIGFLMMLWTEKKQTLHDKMAGTLVLKR